MSNIGTSNGARTGAPTPPPTHVGEGLGPISPPPKLKRRPLLWAIGIALVAVGALGAAWVATTVGDTHSVLALRSSVDRGEVITSEDLVTARISGDPAVKPVSAGDRDQVVGKRAARDLTAGSILTSGQVTSAVIPAAGQSLVGVALTPAQLPATGVRPGDRVRIINTPRQGDQLPADQPESVSASVVDLHPVTNSSNVVVDVTLLPKDAERLTALVATQRLALVVDGAK